MSLESVLNKKVDKRSEKLDYPHSMPGTKEFRREEKRYARRHPIGFAGRGWSEFSFGGTFKIIVIALSLAVILLFLIPWTIALAEAARQSLAAGLRGFNDWLNGYIGTWAIWPWGYLAATWEDRLRGLAIVVSSAYLLFWAWVVFVPKKAKGGTLIPRKNTVFDQPKPVKHGRYGNSRVEYKDRVLASITRTWDPNTELDHAALVLGYSQRLGKYYLSGEDAHCVLVAPPGSGKTSRFLYASLYAVMKSKDSAVVFDNKGELYDATGDEARRSGHKVYVFDYVNWARSQLLNPLSTVTSVYQKDIQIFRKKAEEAARAKIAGDMALHDKLAREAQKARSDAYEKATSMAFNLTYAIAPDSAKGDRFWTVSGRDFLTALVLFVCLYEKSDWRGDEAKAPATPLPEQRTLQTMLALLQKYGKEKTVTSKTSTTSNGADGHTKNDKTEKDSAIELQRFFDNLDPEHPAYIKFSQARNSKEQTLSSIVSTATQYLNTLVTETNNMISYDSEVDLDKIGEEPTIVYLIASTDQQSKRIMVPIVTMLISQACTRCALAHGQSMPRNVHFFMEELGSYDTMPNLKNMVGTGRGYGIRVHAVLQDEAQWRPLFGSDEAQVMENIFNDTVYLNINSYDCAKRVADSIGCYSVLVPEGKSGKVQKGSAVVDAATLMAWDPEWGAFVKRSKNSANTVMNKLFYHRRGVWWAMYPTAPVWWQPATIAMGIDSKAKVKAKAVLAESEDRSAERIFPVPWLAENLTDDEVAELAASFTKGGINPATKRYITDIENDLNEKRAIQLRVENMKKVEEGEEAGEEAPKLSSFVSYEVMGKIFAENRAKEDWVVNPYDDLDSDYADAEEYIEKMVSNLEFQMKVDRKRASKTAKSCWDIGFKDIPDDVETTNVIRKMESPGPYAEPQNLINKRSSLKAQILDRYAVELRKLVRINKAKKPA